MKYQVLGHRRKIQKGDRPYDIVAKFDNLVQLFYMMDKVDKRKYDEVVVIDTYTNEIIANQEFENYEPMIKRRKK